MGGHTPPQARATHTRHACDDGSSPRRPWMLHKRGESKVADRISFADALLRRSALTAALIAFVLFELYLPLRAAFV